MPGFLLQDDAVDARKNAFDDWVEEQKRKAAQAAQTVTSTVSGAVGAAADEVQQRRDALDQWVQQQNAQNAARQAQQTTPAQPVVQPPIATAQPPTESPDVQQ